MLTYKLIKHKHCSFYWNDERLDETKLYTATVDWPDGTQEKLDFFIEIRYEGYDDLPCQYGFLVIIHNGFMGFFEIEDNPEYFNLIKDMNIA